MGARTLLEGVFLDLFHCCSFVVTYLVDSCVAPDENSASAFEYRHCFEHKLLPLQYFLTVTRCLRFLDHDRNSAGLLDQRHFVRLGARPIHAPLLGAGHSPEHSSRTLSRWPSNVCAGSSLLVVACWGDWERAFGLAPRGGRRVLVPAVDVHEAYVAEELSRHASRSFRIAERTTCLGFEVGPWRQAGQWETPIMKIDRRRPLSAERFGAPSAVQHPCRLVGALRNWLPLRRRCS